MRGAAQRVLDTPPSGTIGIADHVARLRHRGVEVLDFSAGRAAEHTPSYICRAASEALLGGDTHQSMAQGKPEFREACSRKLERENGLDADPEKNIIATFGCKHGLNLALMATLNPGDEVIVEDPCFVSYRPAVRLWGGVPVDVPLRPENRFRWTKEDLESAVTDRTRAILFCSPHNPTGTVHDEKDLDVIAELAEEARSSRFVRRDLRAYDLGRTPPYLHRHAAGTGGALHHDHGFHQNLFDGWMANRFQHRAGADTLGHGPNATTPDHERRFFRPGGSRGRRRRDSESRRRSALERLGKACRVGRL